MEEKQIQSFVHRIARDETLREEFVTSPEEVSIREGFTPRVSHILQQIVPQLSFDSKMNKDPYKVHIWA